MKLSRKSGSTKDTAPFREIQNSHRDKYLPRLAEHSLTDDNKEHGHITSRHNAIVDERVSIPTQGRRRKRRVRFRRGSDRTYENKVRLDKLDRKALWYTSEEIKSFTRQTKEAQQTIRFFHPHHDVWSNNLHSVYHSFCSTHNAREIMAVLEATPRHVFHPAGLGMERRAVPLVREDAASRRRQIYMNMDKIQSARVPDSWLRAQILREMSRSISKPSRLYARHVAIMAASGANGASA